MKLSAPPPPPPEPPEPGPAPGPNADNATPTPAAHTPGSPDSPAAEAAPAPAPAPRPATWPTWFAGADAVLAFLVGTVAFLAASFAARNSDLWLHLGAGRMLTTGEYTLGSDPLSFTAADRPWVNHSWLWDLGAFLLYSGDGSTLVLVKALAVAAAVGLLLGIRRPPHALWPWAATAAVAVLAVAPQLVLRPLVGSVVLFAATLFVLFRVPSRPGSWLVPVLIGVIFWVWANVDVWFIVGPIALGLLLLGEVARGTQRTADELADPLGLPDATTLARALLIGIVACMLNPHHYQVWQLPFELVGADGLDADPRLLAARFAPLSWEYVKRPTLGANVNGLAYAALLLTGLYAAFLSGAVGRLLGRPWDVDPVPLPHALLWLGLAALSGWTVYAVPFLAAVTVPVVASRLNLVSARVTLGDRADPGTRLVLTASAAGRVATGVALLGLGVAAWPGWLHPPASNWGGESPADPSAARRVAWAVEPDPGLAAAAGWLAEQRKDGRLPADARGLLANLELANYCAWFAPGEKVFINGRYNHHRPELADYGRVRRALGLVRTDGPPDPAEGREVFERHGLSYAGVAASQGDSAGARAEARRLAAAGLWARPDQWAPWYVDGRTTVAGWRASGAAAPPAFDRLRVDPGVLAFGPGVEPTPVPDGPAATPPAARTAADEFVAGVRPAPRAADEARAWIDYGQVLAGRQAAKTQVAQRLQFLLLRNVPRPSGLLLPGDYLSAKFAAEPVSPEEGAAAEAIWRAPWVNPDAFLAAPVLAVRAARRAIAENPAHPDGYFALGLALADPDLPLTPSERQVGRIVAYRQCLDRMPPAKDYRPGVYATSPADAAAELARLYLGSPLQTTDARGRPAPPSGFAGTNIDLAGIRDLVGEVVLARAGRVARLPFQALQQQPVPPDAQLVAGPVLYSMDLAQQYLTKAEEYAAAEFGGSTPTEAQQRELRSQGEFRKLLDGFVLRARERFLPEARRDPKAANRYRLARDLNLTGDAITILKELSAQDLGREFGPGAPYMALNLVALELATGRVEEAAADLAALRAEFDRLAAQTPRPPQADDLLARLRHQEYQLRWLTGGYADAARALDEIDGPRAARPAYPTPDVALGVGWPIAAGVGGPDTVAPLALWYALREQGRLVARKRTADRVVQDAQVDFRCGVWALLGGDPGAAKAYFARARRPAPPGWDLPNFVHAAAAAYAGFIEAAEKRAAGR